MEPEEAARQSPPEHESGPRPSFEAFWSDHYREFLMTLMAIGATLEEAHDAIHDVIVDMLMRSTWSRLATNPRAWVRIAVRHAYYDQQKLRRKEQPEGDMPLAPERYTSEGPNVWEDWQWVDQMLSTLPPTQRAVVELILCDLSATEIADLLGKTPGTVRQHLAHARKRLRANLGKDYRIDPPGRRKEDHP